MLKKSGVSNDSPDRVNVIVEGSKIIGDFIAESNVRIDGEIQGNVSSSAKVVIGQTGIISGNLICSDADIEGKVDGTIKVEGLLSLRSNAKIVGEITTGKIQIEEGAQFSGQCKMSNFTPKSASAAKPVQEDVVY